MFELQLPHYTLGVGTDGRAASTSDVHGVWMLASQDCELAWTPGHNTDAIIEVRPLMNDDPPDGWGIRSHRKLVTPESYLVAHSPRMMVSPQLISTLAGDGHVLCLLPDSARAVKTWLGLRYDRPAVPGRFVDLHKKIRFEITRKRHREIARHVRDVMVRYGDEPGVPAFELIAVLPQSDRHEGAIALDQSEAIEKWLADVALAIPAELGFASRMAALPADRVSIAFLEEAYSVDASDVSWPHQGGGPVGAVR